LEGVEKQGKTGRPERVRPLFQRTVKGRCMLRVVVIDDSPVARDLIVEILNNETDITVVGIATDGQEGVELVQELQPDVVTMDVQMPRMDGYEATREIMIAQPTPIVVVSGSMNQPDVDKSMQSLQAGALTVIGKPHAPTSPQFAHTAGLLVDTVRSMSGVKVVRHRRQEDTSATDPSSSDAVTTGNATQVIAIGASTGGPQTVHGILSALPDSFPLPILYVQHISDGFTEGMARWLTSTTMLDVRIAVDGEALAGGTVYLAPEGRHLEVSPDSRIVLTDHVPQGGFRPSVSVLFESVARSFGQHALAVILTGMGRDGVDGLKAIRQLGGQIIAQDKSSSVVYGMPKAAFDEGLVDTMMNPQEIVEHLCRVRAPPMTRIQVVEDSDTQAAEIEFLLEEAGYEVAVAKNGLVALEAIRETRPDLVLTDLHMPETPFPTRPVFTHSVLL
jgi:two-component system chemotaxis response regulator CheB